MSPATRYIIQVDRPGERVDMATIRSLLDGVGVTVDPDYGPVPINRQLGRYVVRGVASPDARERAERIPGVRFFADAIKSLPLDGALGPRFRAFLRARLDTQRLDRRRGVDHPVAQVVVPAVAPQIASGPLQQALELRRRQPVRGESLAQRGRDSGGNRTRGRGAPVGGVNARPREVTEACQIGFTRVPPAGPL